jgi:hypothetical protein
VSSLLSWKSDKSDGNSVVCYSEEELAEGDPDFIRYQIDLDLPGYEVSPAPNVDIGGGPLCVRRLSLLAFYRVFYERMMSAQTVS